MGMYMMHVNIKIVVLVGYYTISLFLVLRCEEALVGSSSSIVESTAVVRPWVHLSGTRLQVRSTCGIFFTKRACFLAWWITAGWTALWNNIPGMKTQVTTIFWYFVVWTVRPPPIRHRSIKVSRRRSLILGTSCGVNMLWTFCGNDVLSASYH